MVSTPKRRRTGIFVQHYPVDENNEDEKSEEFTVSPSPITPKKRRSTGRSNTDLDRSARKRATTKLIETYGEPLDDLEQADVHLAEEIIAHDKLDAEMMSPLRKQLISSNSNFTEEDGSQSLFMDGSEGYFDQHKVREKISTTPFSKAPSLEYHTYIQDVEKSKELTAEGREFLRNMHEKSFSQWNFELDQGFSLAFYGVGSKRDLLMDFVEKKISPDVPVLVVNGYNPSTTYKEVLVTAANMLVEDEELRRSFPRHPPDLLAALVEYLQAQRPQIHIILLIHNIDGETLQSDKAQEVLSKLCEQKQVRAIVSTDNINAPLMWDAAKLARYNFVWHDLTTFELYTVETSFEDPLALGKNRSAVASRGVQYVLASLTSNARRLYRVLLAHQVEKMTKLLSNDDTTTVGSTTHGIEFKAFYRRCTEELIVSNELNFRTMLTEFIEHKMAVITKNLAGFETVYAPFTKDACESILDDMLEI